MMARRKVELRKQKLRVAKRIGARASLPKAATGIQGLDEITAGGLPRGRPTLVCGGTGCGKTLLALEFLVHGATHESEPGVLIAFEESPAELVANVASLGFDLEKLQARKLLAIDWVRVERNEIEETGDYDLEGLFVRIGHAIKSVGAKRVVLDTIESLFAALPNQVVLRSELRRLFRWLKERGQTVVITGEKGEGTFTRHGLEEYVSDCVIFLDHRVTEQTSTRRLRVVKYRGSTHGTNEYPFLIDDTGISILPLTSLGLVHKVSNERVSSGIVRLDEMLGGRGYFKGSTILVSGSAGTGKTSIAALFAAAACRRGERCLFFSFEESAGQLVRNLRSIGLRLDRYLDASNLKVLASRPTSQGLEMHLVAMHKVVSDFQPDAIIVDPISSLVSAGSGSEAQSMLTRLIDFLKQHGITALFTSLNRGGDPLEHTEVGISSLIDTWLLLEMVRSSGERNRMLSIIKSRGMAHSNQGAEYRLSADGFELMDTYLGPSGVLTGSARVAREAEDRACVVRLNGDIARAQAERKRRRKLFQTKMVALQQEFAGEDLALDRAIEEEMRRRAALGACQAAMGSSRQAFARGKGSEKASKQSGTQSDSQSGEQAGEQSGKEDDGS